MPRIPRPLGLNRRHRTRRQTELRRERGAADLDHAHCVDRQLPSVGAKPPVPVLLDGVNLVDLVLAEAVGVEMDRPRQACSHEHDRDRDAAQ
jgi:hypothetical protein